MIAPALGDKRAADPEAVVVVPVVARIQGVKGFKE
jgi:hypothetical protein